MEIVIVGVGKVGAAIAEYLVNDEHDVTVVDTQESVIENIINKLDIQGVVGNGTLVDILKEAGVDTARICIATTPSDEVNILICMIARKLGAKHCIARVREPSYSKQHVFMRDELGMSMMINPEYDAANEIARILSFPSAMKFESFAKGRVDIVEIKITPESKIAGMEVRKVIENFKANIVICAIRQGENVFIPNGETIIKPGDKINIAASHSQMVNFFKKLGILKSKSKHVMIVGGGRIAYHLTKQLVEMGAKVKIIENDEKRCMIMSEAFPEATVIHGDGADHNLLVEEGFDEMDACVALTGMDEENIIISMYAEIKNIKKIVCKLTRVSMLGILETIGNASIISPKDITADVISRYVRAKENSDGSAVRTLYRLVDGKIEALEFAVNTETSFTDKPISELKLKENLLIACIIRGNKAITPNGKTTIQVYDRVIVVTTNKKIANLEDILRK